MKITLHSTDILLDLNGVPCRVWGGVSEGGVPIHALIAAIAVHKSHSQAEFEAELEEKSFDAPSPLSVGFNPFPLPTVQT